MAGIQNPNGILTVDKLLITKKNIDTSAGGWFQNACGKSFVTNLSFSSVGRGVQARTLHRIPLPPAAKITLLMMYIEGDTIMADDMLLEVWADYYVGFGGSVVNKALMSIGKPKSLYRCNGMYFLNLDIIPQPPAICIGMELYLSQSNTQGTELNKKVTILARVFYRD